MLLPVKWLKEYVKTDISTRELADRLTLSGSHVDGIISLNKNIENVVIGKIIKKEKHPDADKLTVNQVDIGGEIIQIVTAATNVSEGDIVPVALHGSTLADGTKIKKGKLRGVESQGMFCSSEELGIESSVAPKESRDGIWILEQAMPLGADVREVLGFNGEVLDIEITPNRPDCLSIIGMARETAATLKIALEKPEVKMKEEVEAIQNYMDQVVIEDADNCKRYYGRIVKDIKIGPSPYWMQQRLMEAGIRPINNVVDVTNYVMTELGQPLHAFDYDKLTGKKIVIKRAQADEKYTTLDDVERQLNDSMLVIADGQGTIAIAGVMGGQNTEVSAETTTVFLESANFNGRNIRLTAKALGLRTEASAKFEKDLDPDLSGLACDRACQLLEMIGAGKVVQGAIDEYPHKKENRKVELRTERVAKLLGIEIPQEEMLSILNHLELKAELHNDVIVAEIPSFRNDVQIEADLVEEVGRIYGFDGIEPKPFLGQLTKGVKSDEREIEDIIKAELHGFGMNEITTYSFISPKAYDKIRLSENSIKRKVVKILNPLGEDFSVMRTTLMPNMLEVLSRNFKYGVEDAWAYEAGNVFIPTNDELVTLPYEINTFCVGMYGHSDFYTIKAAVNKVLARLGVEGAEYQAESNHPSFHPGRTANVILNNQLLGIVGEVHPEVLKNYGLKTRVYVAEFDIELLAALSTLKRTYKPLPKYPAVSRDIALVVDRNLPVGDLEKVIKANGGILVDSVQLFDVYTGEQIPGDKKSIAYSILYRSADKTLADEDIRPVHEKILEALENQCGATLRA